MQFFAHDCTKVIHSFQHSNPRPTPSEARQKIVLQTSNTMYKRQVRETQRERKQCIATYRAKCRHLPAKVWALTTRSANTYQTKCRHLPNNAQAPILPHPKMDVTNTCIVQGHNIWLSHRKPTITQPTPHRGHIQLFIQTDISHSPSPMTHAPWGIEHSISSPLFFPLPKASF